MEQELLKALYRMAVAWERMADAMERIADQGEPELDNESQTLGQSLSDRR